MSSDTLKFEERLLIWEILFELCDKNEAKMNELLTLEDKLEESNLAKYLVAKKRKYNYLNKL